MSEVKKTQEIEIDSDVVEAVAEKAAESIKVPSADEVAEKVASLLGEKAEKVEKKDIHESATPKATKILKTGMESLPKEVRFTKAVIANLRNDGQTMAEYNAYVNKAWQDVSKANYQNVTTTADGGALVPDPEFVAEVERLTDDYGVAARLANVRRTDRDSVTLLSGTNEISFTKTNEATAVNATKLTYTAATATLEKYIATLIMTSEIVEDSAVDMFVDATNEVARARAKLFDQLVFTDATHGLLTPSVGGSYKTQTVGAAITNFDADDAMNARYQVKSSARANGRYFMHPSVFNLLRQTKEATTGGYLFGPVGQSVTPTIDGVPVELVDVMPAVGEIGANKAFAVFGDLSRIQLHVKRLLETKVFDSGVVKDSGGSDFNLITQDAFAMRATLRVVPQTRFDGAFTIIGTGTVS
jgi:HK97 family phage major capsid protein